MSAPEPTAVERTIAEVLRVHRGSACASVEGRPGWLCLACSGPGRNEWLDDAGLDHHCAQAVVAAIRAMSATDLADVIKERGDVTFEWGAINGSWRFVGYRPMEIP